MKNIDPINIRIDSILNVLTVEKILIEKYNKAIIPSTIDVKYDKTRFEKMIAVPLVYEIFINFFIKNTRNGKPIFNGEKYLLKYMLV